jgi:omega-6 fatty acid desaturase (delta-12 desaturase)
MRALRQQLSLYQHPSHARSILEIFLSAAPLAAIWTLGWFALDAGLWWAALLLNIPAAGFVLRMFMIQHDCGHKAFFRSHALNDWTGRVIGIVTLTPYDCWKREHAIHHATSGDLDRRGPGAIHTLTVDEYAALAPLQRLGYRLYRHPVVLFLVGPVFVFFLQQRLPVGLMKEGWRPWVSAMGTNAGLAVVVALAVWLGGWQGLLLVHLPTVMIAACVGVWLFFVQHQFEETHWDRHEDWDATESALKGSSYYHLPAPLQWLTANIGVHHVHHVASRIPFYRLPTVLKQIPHLNTVSRLTLGQSLRCVSLALWDEANRRLITFGQFRRSQRMLAAPG